MKSCLAFLFIVSASVAGAGQISVVNPPNIVTPAPVIPTAPSIPTVGTPSVATDVVLPGFGDIGLTAVGGLTGARRGELPTPVSSFPVESMSIPQMQQALISISQLLSSGRLRPAQAAVLQNQAERMVRVLNAGG